MSYETLLYDAAASVVRITVNRPDKLNALDRQTLVELGEAMERAAKDDAARVVILTGAGDKAFVAGADISQINALTPMKALEFSRLGQAVMSRIENLGKPVIAAVNGFALGGGCELAMACTLRVAAEGARLGLPEITLGLMPGFGGTQRMVRLAGRSATLELALSGAPIGAARARDLGLVGEVVPDAQLTERVDELAGHLAKAAPLALRSIIEAVNLGAEASLERGLEHESQLFALCCSTADMREGTTAFLEKRKPTFEGT